MSSTTQKLDECIKNASSPVLQTIYNELIFGNRSAWNSLKVFATDRCYDPLVFLSAPYLIDYMNSKYSHIEIVIYGPPGTGKTSYVVSGLKYISQFITSPVPVEELMIFNAEDLLNLIEKLQDLEIRVPFLLVDDPATLGLGSYWTQADKNAKQFAREMLEMFTTIKDYASVVYYTVPRLTDMAKKLRDFSTYWFRLQASALDKDYVRVIVSKDVPILGKSHSISEKNVVVAFYVWKLQYMPDEIWNKMMKKRRDFAKLKLEKAKSLFYSAITNPQGDEHDIQNVG